MKKTIVMKWERQTNRYQVYSYDAGGNKPFNLYLPKHEGWPAGAGVELEVVVTVKGD